MVKVDCSWDWGPLELEQWRDARRQLTPVISGFHYSSHNAWVITIKYTKLVAAIIIKAVLLAYLIVFSVYFLLHSKLMALFVPVSFHYYLNILFLQPTQRLQLLSSIMFIVQIWYILSLFWLLNRVLYLDIFIVLVIYSMTLSTEGRGITNQYRRFRKATPSWVILFYNLIFVYFIEVAHGWPYLRHVVSTLLRFLWVSWFYYRGNPRFLYLG